MSTPPSRRRFWKLWQIVVLFLDHEDPLSTEHSPLVGGQNLPVVGHREWGSEEAHQGQRFRFGKALSTANCCPLPLTVGAAINFIQGFTADPQADPPSLGSLRVLHILGIDSVSWTGILNFFV